MSGEDTAEIMDTFREGLADKTTVFPVSYTHLTLPTIYSV